LKDKEKNIEKIDKNFVGEELRYDGLKLYRVTDPTFRLYGLYQPYDGTAFRRMPRDVAITINPCVQELYTHTSGGRIRFRTDSEKIFLRAVLPEIVRFDHMPKTGSGCFDLYVDGEYHNVFRHGNLSGMQKREAPANAYDS